MKELKKKALTGVFWTFIDRAGSQFIGFVITIFLVRMLTPTEFGLIAMASVFNAIAQVFVDSGLNDSLIQKKECTDEDYNTVFYFNIGIGILICLLLFLSAPLISDFFGYDELTPIIRVLAFRPLISSFSYVQIARIKKDLAFHRLARGRIPAFIISGVVGLLLAWNGLGVWALVAQALLETFLFNVVLWYNSSWRPSFFFNKEVFQFHWKHGSRLLMVSVLNSLYTNIFSLVIGKFFSPIQLGYYSRADSFRTIILNNTTGLIQTVSYPILTKFQDNDSQLVNAYRKIQQANLFLILPVAGLFIIGAEPIVVFLLTSKWLPTAPILSVLMLALVFSPFNSNNIHVLKVKRRTDLVLRANLVNKALIVGILLITVNLGFEFVIWTNLIIAVLALFVNNYYTNKLIGYSIKDQIIDLWPLLLAFTGTVFITKFLMDRAVFDYLLIKIIVTGLSVVLGYGLIIFLIKRSLISYVLETVRSLWK